MTSWRDGFKAYPEGTQGSAERSSYFLQCWYFDSFLHFLFVFIITLNSQCPCVCVLIMSLWVMNLEHNTPFFLNKLNGFSIVYELLERWEKHATTPLCLTAIGVEKDQGLC